MMKKYFALLYSVLILIASCNKNPDKPDLHDANGDTTKILTLVEYDYNNGNIEDSTFKNLESINGPSGKQFIITAQYPDEGPDITTYNLNLQNQLTEIDYSYGYDPGAHDRDIITWSGSNLSKIENEESGKITHTYNFTYTPEGSRTRITYTEIPQKLDTVFGNDGHIVYNDYSKSAFIVSTADFKPVGIEAFGDSYLNNNPANSPEVIRDTLNTRFVLTPSGDFQQKIITTLRVDSNANEHAGVINHYKDSIIYNYDRDNKNESFSAVLKSLMGDHAFIISSFYYTEFAYNDLLPEMYENYYFINHPLNKETRESYSWENGVRIRSTPTIEEHILANSYDIQNRLISSQVLNLNNKPEYGFKIIWP